ncbi:unnamed protein product [Clavelina lepadiformis]|uniref:Reverse transcriptase domain-containing protein n=2 Tax=Clavelina lepadiformis TaxID=159417 RepID=A0ABP0GW86_CLALP
MKKGKTPGPDGLSIEFYVQCWDIIGGGFLEVIKTWFRDASTTNANKEGVITLIHKKGPTNDLSNYRPISLLNCDLKLYTKILTNRLKGKLNNITHQNQFAKPQKSIHDAIIKIRDLYEKSRNEGQNHLFISIDFLKAFDSINHAWLFKVLERMHFPSRFLLAVKNLYSDAKSRIINNGFLSEPFHLKKGVRQGDPLSLYLFILAVEPLICAINSSVEIDGLGPTPKYCTKCVAYADDTTFTLKDAYSAEKTFKLLDDFSEASGLKINISKSKGLTPEIKPNTTTQLPPIQWTNSQLQLLGTAIGTYDPTISWSRPLENLKKEATRLKKVHSTFDAKCILVRSKLLPLISYNAFSQPITTKTAETINRTIERYILTSNNTFADIEVLQRPRDYGGYDIINIPVYADLFYLKPLTPFCRDKIENKVLSLENRTIEHQIGHQLSNLLGIQIDNRIPHATSPSIYYGHMLEIIRKHRISLKEIVSGKVKKIYQRIIRESAPQLYLTPPERSTWPRVHNAILSNAQKTFNYRVIWNDLPTRGDMTNFVPYTETACRFCANGPDSVLHTIVKCKKINTIWECASGVAQILTGRDDIKFDPTTITNFDGISGPDFESADMLTYWLTVVKQKIWKHRNAILFESQTFNPDEIIRSIKRTVYARRTWDRRNEGPYKQQIEKLCAAMQKFFTPPLP